MDKSDSVSAYEHEGMRAIFGMIIRRLITALVIAVILMVMLAGYFCYAISKTQREMLDYLSQYDYACDTTTTVTQDGKGVNVYGGGNVSWDKE